MHRLSQPVGKQYTYGKGPDGLNKELDIGKREQATKSAIRYLKKVPRYRKELEPQFVIQVVEEYSSTYKISDIIAVLEVPKATFYRWMKK